MANIGIFIVVFLSGMIVCFGLITLLNFLRGKNLSQELEKRKKEAEEKANSIIKEADLRAKEIILQKREEFEKETEATKEELKEIERRLTRKEDSLAKKLEMLDRREENLNKVEEELRSKEQNLKIKERELEEVFKEQKELLLKISGMTEEQARQLLLEKLEKELEIEYSEIIKKKNQLIKERAEEEAREIIAMAMQRCSVDVVADVVVSTVDLPSDEMKGRVIGREGRNIRAFEKITGVDVIVDDTPGVVVISCFDSIRREIARRALEELIADGRIHPARIEEVVEKSREEVYNNIKETGKKVLFDLGIHNIHPKLVELVGRLKYRTSYGQNVLQHSVEVALLAGIIAGQMKLDEQTARRAGILHDIGKAVDQELEGTHPQIGAELARRYDESPEIINAIESHHEDVPYESLYGVIVHVADAISAARPGARRETLEKYVKRLEKLESLATSFEGVEKAFAIQAGREIRVIVKPEKVADSKAMKICRDLAKQIETDMSYPGEIKVSVIRETRFEEYAR